MNNKLKYIEAAANESLRFKPVAPIILHEAIRDTEIEGYEIKTGQKVLTQYRHGALSKVNTPVVVLHSPDHQQPRCDG